ncbi:hypothetical protein BDV95DRAFT_578068 [Massariosphaeria phaeospora]|uniref:Secreted protein n=1 Tax=Massariosphaeria phaeospora TaxID=100035 RepID=A0A7C8I770_9PLEO|nr:hypothetical protein BDV95DRAFT_578068 [Massariosphaeria phaeospora]
MMVGMTLVACWLLLVGCGCVGGSKERAPQRAFLAAHSAQGAPSEELREGGVAQERGSVVGESDEFAFESR